MKKTSKSKDEPRSEYDLAALKGGVRGKHYERYQAGTNLALLSPDVRAAFPTDDDVNKALRTVMQKNGKKTKA